MTLSLNQSMFHAYLSEPNMAASDARKIAAAATKSITNRNRRRSRVTQHEAPPPRKRTKGDGTFMSYTDICMSILRDDRLTVVPRAIIFLSTNVIAPSPTFLAALMHRLREIACNNVNLMLIKCILGVEKSDAFDLYLRQVKDWNARDRPCQELVAIKGQITKRTCNARINFGKDKCSYHLRRACS